MPVAQPRSETRVFACIIYSRQPRALNLCDITIIEITQPPPQFLWLIYTHSGAAPLRPHLTLLLQLQNRRRSAHSHMHAREKSIDQVAKRRICENAPPQLAFYGRGVQLLWLQREMRMKQAAAEIAAVLPTDRGDNARLIMRCIRNRSARFGCSSCARCGKKRFRAEWNSRMHSHMWLLPLICHETNWKLADMKTDDMQRSLVRSTCC